MVVKTPRDYQANTHTSTWNYIHNPDNFGNPAAGIRPKNPLIVQATGLGKSLNIAMFMYQMLSVYPSLKIMNCVHTKELVEGNYKELLGMWPAAPAGVYAAGLNMRNTRAQAIYAMIQSVAKRAPSFGHVDFLLIDEVHRLDNKGTSQYEKFITELRKTNPNLIVVGYTATPFRLGLGHLLDGDMFDDVVYDIGSGESFLWAVNQGYLIMPVPTNPGFQVDDSDISITGGEFNTGEASAAVQDIMEEAVDFTIQLASEENRIRSLTFAQSIGDSELIADMYTYKGFESHAVHSKRSDRDDILAAHKKGEFWGVVNKDILTTGYNDPWLDLMVGLRLTRSPGLWVQMVGRMTRPVWLPGYDISTREGRWASILASHKQNARVLDFCGNTERLGPINYPRMPARRGKGGGDAPVRTCKLGSNLTEDGVVSEVGCNPGTFHHTSVKICPHCGYEWPVATSLTTLASTASLVSETNPLGMDIPPPVEKEFEVFSVHQMIAMHHKGKGDKPDTLKVDYISGFRTFPTWVCLAHGEKTFPRRKARDWWKAHGGQGEAPTDIETAVELAGDLEKPKFIKVWVNQRYPSVEGYDHIGTRFEEPDLTDLANPYKIYEPEPDPAASLEEATAKFQEFALAGAGLQEGYDDFDIPF